MIAYNCSVKAHWCFHDAFYVDAFAVYILKVSGGSVVKAGGTVWSMWEDSILSRYDQEVFLSSFFLFFHFFWGGGESSIISGLWKNMLEILILYLAVLEGLFVSALVNCFWSIWYSNETYCSVIPNIWFFSFMLCLTVYIYSSLCKELYLKNWFTFFISLLLLIFFQLAELLIMTFVMIYINRPSPCQTVVLVLMIVYLSFKCLSLIEHIGI